MSTTYNPETLENRQPTAPELTRHNTIGEAIKHLDKTMAYILPKEDPVATKAPSPLAGVELEQVVEQPLVNVPTLGQPSTETVSRLDAARSGVMEAYSGN